MELHIYNSTHDELEKNKHSIFIGISINKKLMSMEAAKSSLQWALDHSSDRIQILIADEITRYNILAFGHSTQSGALSRAIRDGDKYYDFFDKLLHHFEAEERARFNIVRWKEIQTQQYAAILKEVQHEFEMNNAFRSEILSIQEIYVKRRNATITDQKKLLLSQYLLEEIPTLLDGVHVNNKRYSLMLYPTYTLLGMAELANLVSDIQNRRKFLELSCRIKFSNTIMVESIIQDHLIVDQQFLQIVDFAH